MHLKYPWCHCLISLIWIVSHLMRSRTISRITIVWSTVSWPFPVNMSSVMKWVRAGTQSYCKGSLIKQTTRRTFLHFFTPDLPAFRKSSAVLHGHLYIFHLQIWSSSNDVNTPVGSCYASDSQGSWWAPGSIFSVQKPRDNQQNRPWNTERRFLRPPTHSLTRVTGSWTHLLAAIG